MIAFPPAKINLGLRVVRKRDDGFHDLQTIFLAVPFCDILEVIADPAAAPGTAPRFSSSGRPVDGPQEQNICLRAYQLLQRDFPALPAVQIHLHKILPMGAGLGGGSSDGAHTLLLLNQVAGLGLSPEQLEAYALALGSDCPFFIRGTACYAEGRGERMMPVDLNLQGYTLVLIHPGIHVSTADAFRGIRPTLPDQSLADLIQRPPSEWKGRLVNDFEATIIPLHPEIGRLRDMLYAAGADYASMSGSGSAVYGLFPGSAPALPSLPASYTVAVLPAALGAKG